MQFPNGPELIFIIALALIIFGPKKLPEIGKSIGQGLRELRKASREITSAFDFTNDLSLDDDDTSFSSSVIPPRPEADAHVEKPKENEQNAANSLDTEWTGVVGNSSGDSAGVRSEEDTGNRQIDG